VAWRWIISFASNRRYADSSFMTMLIQIMNGLQRFRRPLRRTVRELCLFQRFSERLERSDSKKLSIIADDCMWCIGCPTSNVAQANLTMKINFKRLRSLSSSDILTIYLHAFLQCSVHSRKTAFKISRGISDRITQIRTRNSDGVSP
jgi:hypothetical protein